MHDDSNERSSTLIFAAMALGVFILHLLTNHRYGFHRDELQTLGDARYLDWGFVAYPPLTPFFGRLSLILFGNSVTGARVFPALAQAIVIVLGGLIARELGGRRFAQVTAALAVAVAPVALSAGALLQYVTFDFLWWVLLTYLVVRLVRTNNERLWIPIGVIIGLGMMTKYTMLFLVAGLAVGVLTSNLRSRLKSQWLWVGVAISLLIFLPNAIWQIRHHFITLDFLKYIHGRDIRIGRTKDFLPEQLWVAANVFTIPIWIAGLIFYFRPVNRQFRVLGFMFLVPLILFTIAKGRGYYMAPAYPILLAAGAVAEERWLASLPRPARVKLLQAATLIFFIVGGVLVAPAVMPLAPVGSKPFNMNGDFREELGWPDLAAEVARIYRTLPADQQAQSGILAGNYGEAGALDMYGPQYALPRAVSGTNSYWLRGYPDPPPQTLIVLGLNRRYADQLFQSCEVVGHNTNRYGIKNEESADHPDIFLCHDLRQPWPDFWSNFRHFG